MTVTASTLLNPWTVSTPNNFRVATSTIQKTAKIVSLIGLGIGTYYSPFHTMCGALVGTFLLRCVLSHGSGHIDELSENQVRNLNICSIIQSLFCTSLARLPFAQISPLVLGFSGACSLYEVAHDIVD